MRRARELVCRGCVPDLCAWCPRGCCYHDDEGGPSLLFIVSFVLVSALGLCRLVLFLVKRDGLVQIVKGCSRRKDEEGRGPWQQAERSGPHSGWLENAELMQNCALHVTSLRGSGALRTHPTSLIASLLMPLETHPHPHLGPSCPWPPVLWTKPLVLVMLQLAKRQCGNPRTRPPTFPNLSSL